MRAIYHYVYSVIRNPLHILHVSNDSTVFLQRSWGMVAQNGL